MAKACGLRVGPRGYELVLLEGSAKKHKVVLSEAGELSLASDPEGAVETLKELGNGEATKFIFPMEFTNLLSPFIKTVDRARDGEGSSS